MSSLSFSGNATSYLRIPNTNDFDFGTGDFTIEWYQYQTDLNSFPRIFQVGNYPNISIGVSIEGGNFLYWANNSYNSVTSVTKNQWIHFAICRVSGVTNIFKNGTSVFSMSDTNNFNGVNDLNIANESTPSNNAAFGGYLTYFSWVKGAARYTSNFTVSNNYPPTTDVQVLLLKASDFGGTLGSTVVNNIVSTTPNVPPGFLNQNTPVANTITLGPERFKSMFTDNAMVYYKPNSLASCGVGTVRNSTIKARKT